MGTDYRSLITTALGHFNRGDLDRYLELYRDDIRIHGLPPDLPPGIEGVKAFYLMFFSAFPDAKVTAKDFLVDSDRVAVRFTLTGTHKGAFMGIPATGRPISADGITILRFEGKVCPERWTQSDMLGILTQIGAMPAAAA